MYRLINPGLRGKFFLYIILGPIWLGIGIVSLYGAYQGIPISRTILVLFGVMMGLMGLGMLFVLPMKILRTSSVVRKRQFNEKSITLYREGSVGDSNWFISIEGGSHRLAIYPPNWNVTPLIGKAIVAKVYQDKDIFEAIEIDGKFLWSMKQIGVGG